MEDRRNLAELNERFDGLERIAGNRKVDVIEVNCVRQISTTFIWTDP